MTALALRPYQSEAIDAVTAAWGRGVRSPAVVLPTGTGKTVIFSELCARIAASGGRPLILVHRDELLSQTMSKISALDPHLEVGAVKGSRNHVGDITVASVPTMGRTSRLPQWAPDLFTHVVVDEAHHAAAKTYRQTFDHFAEALRVGFSATLSRTDGGLADVWDDVVYQMDVVPAIAAGYLVDVRGKSVVVSDLDMGATSSRSGDWTDKDLGARMSASSAADAVVSGYLEHATRDDGSVRPGICFAPTVDMAESFAEKLNHAGIRTRCVFGSTPWDDRADIYDGVRRGDIDVISSVMVLTEGFDLPEVEVAVIARPTTNPALYTQMVGRVLRPAPWSRKREALVLHVAGATSLGVATLAELTPSRVQVADGELLSSAAKSKAKAKSTSGLSSAPGTPEWEDVDMFAGSQSAWLQTRNGVWFIPTASDYVFLWPDSSGRTSPVDRWRVGVTPARSSGGRWEHTVSGIDVAMTLAESVAAEIDPSISAKSAPWRRRKTPSDKMISFAAALGIDHTGMRAGALSDAITVVLASRKFDRPDRRKLA